VKVVLFCGGRGTRIREFSERVPKPLIPVGYRPIIWHLMKYYAHFGHRDFVLALGYRADAIKSFFLEYNEAISNDFTMHGCGGEVRLASSDMDDWTITFVDTGIDSNIGERLMALRPHLEGEEAFLANYSDGLTDLDLDAYVGGALETGAVATFLAVKPPLSYHLVQTADCGKVTGMSPISSADLWINGGFFVLRQEIFDYIGRGEELVQEPFHRLLEEQRLRAVNFDGFWAPMDTFKEWQRLEDLNAKGNAPWEVWKEERQKVAAQ